MWQDLEINDPQPGGIALRHTDKKWGIVQAGSGQTESLIHDKHIQWDIKHMVVPTQFYTPPLLTKIYSYINLKLINAKVILIFHIMIMFQ